MSDSLEAVAHGYAAIEEQKRNMTKEQLKARGLVLAEMVQQEADLASLRAQNAELVAALKEAWPYVATAGTATDWARDNLIAKIDAALAAARQSQGRGK